MNIVTTGSSGLIGSALAGQLTGAGHCVLRVVRRRAASDDEVSWDPGAGSIEAEKLEATDAVVHLAGENIAEGRWTAAKKARIRESRVRGTELLCETLSALRQKPRVLVSASAIGYYGDQGDVWCDETAPVGDGFLSEVCAAWEAATGAATRAGIRVVSLRIGMVLSPQGGALAKMLLPFKLGGGGRIGSGEQFWSWISLDDLVGVILHCLEADMLSGPVNAVAPNPVTNFEFTKSLGGVLRRPTLMPMPAMVARIAFGEMADALLLASARVAPKRLIDARFEFRHPILERALRHLLGVV